MAEWPPRGIVPRRQAFAVSVDASRSLMVVWLVVFAAPISLLSLMALPVIWQAWPLGTGHFDAWSHLGGTACLAALIALWALAGSLVLGGPAALARRAQAWWWCAGLGPLVLLIATAEHNRAGSTPSDGFPFLLGWPLVLPLAHLGLEVWLRPRSGVQR